MSTSDQSALSSGGRARGRPSIGPTLPVRLDASEKEFSELLGDGVAAKGVRRAINVAKTLGLDASRRIAPSKSKKSGAQAVKPKRWPLPEHITQADESIAEAKAASMGEPSEEFPVRISLPDAELDFLTALGSGDAETGMRHTIAAAGQLGFYPVYCLANADEKPAATNPSDVSTPAKRKNGKIFTSNLTHSENLIAIALGNRENGKGSAQEGVHNAIRACFRLGIAPTLRLVD